MGKILWAVCLMAALAACAGDGYHRVDDAVRRAELAAIQTRLALAYLQASDLKNAVAAAEQAVRVYPQSQEAWLVNGRVLQLAGWPDQAEESLRQALALNPLSAEANNNYGWFLCSVRQHPAQALAYFERALADKTYREPYVAHLNMGICLRRQGAYAQAQQHFLAALQYAADFAPAVKESAQTYYLAQDYAAARQRYHQLRKLKAKPDADELFLGWQIARALGDMAAASADAWQLRNTYPYSPQRQLVDGRISAD